MRKIPSPVLIIPRPTQRHSRRAATRPIAHHSLCPLLFAASLVCAGNDISNVVAGGHGAFQPAGDEIDPSLYAGAPAWNLNLLPTASGSVLKSLPQSIQGITQPWLYMGMLFATFAWSVMNKYKRSAMGCGGAHSGCQAPRLTPFLLFFSFSVCSSGTTRTTIFTR